ncbi:MAG: STAS-like domain-containing protein [Verrucomicrobiales bacterium]|nr:STAS-like domain-containing protein [Verrucomicrobiales bacterium]
MPDPIRISIAELIGKPRAIAAADGEMVFKEIYPLVKEGTPVALSFAGIRMVITAFLNAAIGKLYRGDIPFDEVDRLVEVVDLAEAFQPALEHSKTWSKAYYADPERLERAIKEEYGDEE